MAMTTLRCMVAFSATVAYANGSLSHTGGATATAVLASLAALGASQNPCVSDDQIAMNDFTSAATMTDGGWDLSDSPVFATGTDRTNFCGCSDCYCGGRGGGATGSVSITFSGAGTAELTFLNGHFSGSVIATIGSASATATLEQVDVTFRFQYAPGQVLTVSEGFATIGIKSIVCISAALDPCDPSDNVNLNDFTDAATMSGNSWDMTEFPAFQDPVSLCGIPATGFCGGFGGSTEGKASVVLGGAGIAAITIRNGFTQDQAFARLNGVQIYASGTDFNVDSTVSFAYAEGDILEVAEGPIARVGVTSIVCNTLSPTQSPTDSPTTSAPTTSPTDSPTTSAPTTSPTDSPTTSSPTTSPTDSPTTSAPTTSPTDSPTTAARTTAPTETPGNPTAVPTAAPTASPTSVPTTAAPTAAPTTAPTDTLGTPTAAPTVAPTLAPTSACPFYEVRVNDVCEALQACNPDQFIIAEPTPTSNRQCQTVGAGTVVDASYTADAADSNAATVVQTNVAGGQLDATGRTVIIQPPSKEDNPPPGLLYVSAQLNVSNVAADATASVVFLSDRALFFSSVKADIATSLSQAEDPIATAILVLNDTTFTFRVGFGGFNGGFADTHPFVTLVTDFVNNLPAFQAATGLTSTTLLTSLTPLVQPFIHTICGQCGGPGDHRPVQCTRSSLGACGESAAPTAIPTVAPTAAPTAQPTAAPTAGPTAIPTTSPTAAPTATPTAAPSATPTASPTAAPTATPTASPTAAPTATPTALPTLAPTSAAAAGGGGGGAAGTIAGVVVVMILLVVVLVLVFKRHQDGKVGGAATSATVESKYARDTDYRPQDAEVIDFRQPQPMHPSPPQSQYMQQQTPPHPQAPAPAPSAAQPLAPGSDVGLNIPPVPRLPPVQSHEVDANQLAATIIQMSANSDFAFSEEYETLETGQEFSREAALRFENKTKNRYANILPYDYTRVRLSLLPHDNTSDYINANYIDGWGDRRRHYIAAQGPTPLTVIDFWRMMWECKVPVIVMVTNCEEKGRIKCQRYWPASLHEPMPLLEGFSVRWKEVEEFPDFVIRTLEMEKDGERMMVKQYHYTSWPDHGVPESTAGTLLMLRKARAARGGSDGPMVVHCSAGVGRTGTLLAIDLNMDRLAEQNKIDVFATLNGFRRQRNTMVQTEEQYIFIYKSLADASNNVNAEMSLPELQMYVRSMHQTDGNGVTKLEREFKLLGAQLPSGNVRTDSAQIADNKKKNRFQNVLPYESTRVRLAPLPGVIGSDYINASFIDGYTKRNAYIATQGPLEGTLPDFWRAIWEYEVDVVVMLTELIENGRAKSDQYWPDADEGSTIMGDFQVTLKSEEVAIYGFVRMLTVTNLVSDESREVRQYQYTVWPANGSKPLIGTLPDLLASIQEYQRSKIVLSAESDIYGNVEAINAQSIAVQTKPLMVHDAAGVGRTGAFLALHIGLERYGIESKVDLFTTIKHMRTQRMSMVQTHDQLEWAYVSLLEAIEKPADASMALYENIGVGRRGIDESGAAHAAPAASPPVDLPPLPAKTSGPSAMPPLPPKLMSSGPSKVPPAPPARAPTTVAETSFTGGTPGSPEKGYIKVEGEDLADDFSEPPETEESSLAALQEAQDFDEDDESQTYLV